MSPASVTVDAAHGARWTSLRGTDGKEWLWQRAAPQRTEVRHGDPFVDAGGLEECFPTLSGVPDHGEVWTQAWTPEDDGLTARGDWYDLHRSIAVEDDEISARYLLRAEPGRRFIWAAHALLDVSTSARLVAPEGHPMTVHGRGGSVVGSWPISDGTDLSLLGPADGTLTDVRLPGLPSVTVVDGASRLTLTLHVDDQPQGFLIWRNLGGWPAPDPYRSIGVEPLIGRGATLATAGPGDAGEVPAAGELRWTLRVRASG